MFLFAGTQQPLIVDFVNKYFGEYVYRFQLAYTKPFWDNYVFGPLGKDTETVLGVYSPETAIPWYTVMFVISCLLTVTIIWILKGKLSSEDPQPGQLTLEAGYLAVRDLAMSVIGPHAMKYFPVVATFAVLIMVSNLMVLFPLFMPPTESVSVTFALGITSFVYYNYVGIKENGIVKHLAHLTGPIWWIAPLIFMIELFSNIIRPATLGIRLFANMFADAQIGANLANLYPPFSQFIFPVIVLPLATFVSLVQTLVFVLLSMIYISEVTHAPHDDHGHDHAHGDAHSEPAKA